MATASWLVFRSGRFLTWARLGIHPGFEEMTWTTHDGMPAIFPDDQVPTLGEFVCQADLEIPE
jgi:hypothetical protein